jgi:hypothetical protein
MIRPTAAVLCSALLAATTPFQDPKPPKELILEAGEHAARDLVDRCAEFLGRNHLYDPAELTPPLVRIPITLQNRLVLTKQNCVEVVEGLLYSVGLVFVPVNRGRDIWEVVHTQGARRGEIVARPIAMAPADVMAQRSRKVYVQCTVQLATVNAMQACNQLRPLLQNQQSPLQIGTVGENRALILQGYVDAVASAIEIVGDADSAAAGAPDPQSGEPVPAVRVQLEALQGEIAAMKKRLERLEAGK